MLRGVSHSGTEYGCVHPYPRVFEGPLNSTFTAGLKTWPNVNVVRMPLNEDCWLGINGVEGSVAGANYIAAYSKAVELLTSNNIAVIADLHWTAPGSQLATGQQALPDADHALHMWTEVATQFKSNPLVIFELFNEPFAGKGNAGPADWACWRNGSCSGAPDINFEVAGMEQLIKAVRATGATNIILLGGMAWSNDLSMWLQYAPVEADILNNTGAVWHAYDFNACHDQSCWERTISPVKAKVPVVVTESGFDVTWSTGLWKWLEGQHISYLAWTYNTWPGDTFAGLQQGLVTDYAHGTPSTPWGEAFKSQLASVY